MSPKLEKESKLLNKVPGPGNYSPKRDTVEKSISHKITFGQKTELPDIKNNGAKIQMPGPGKYTLPSTLEKISPAKFGTEKRTNISLKERIRNPGPGTYNTIVYVDKPKGPNYVYLIFIIKK